MDCIDDITRYCNILRETLLTKNDSYKGSVFEKPLLAPNVSPFESILVRMGDKVKRLQYLLGGGEPVFRETIADALKDLAGYSVLALIEYEKGNEK